MSSVNRPVVYLAFAHESKKNKGIKIIKSLFENLTNTFDRFVTQSCDPVLDLQREGKDGLPYAFEVFAAELQYPHLSVIHIASEPALEGGDILFNAMGGKRRQLDIDNLFLDHLKDLKLIIVDGGATNDFVEKLLFAGAPAVIGLNYTEESQAAVNFIERFYHRLIQGNPLQTSFECAAEAMEIPCIVREIASDPYEYWETKEKEDPNAPFSWGLYYLSANHDALSWQIVDPADVIENMPEEVIAPELEVLPPVLMAEEEPEIELTSEVQEEPEEIPAEEIMEETPDFFDMIEAESAMEEETEIEFEPDLLEEESDDNQEEDSVIISAPLFFQARPGGIGSETLPFATQRLMETNAISALSLKWGKGKTTEEIPLAEEEELEELPVQEETTSPVSREIQLYQQPDQQEQKAEKSEPPVEEKKQEEPVAKETHNPYSHQEQTYTYSGPLDEEPSYRNTYTRPTRTRSVIDLFPKWKNIAGIGVGIAATFAGIFLLMNLFSPGAQKNETSYLNAFATGESYNVLILPFRPYPGCKSVDAFDEIAVRDRLNSLEESSELNIKAVYIDEGACPDNFEEARRIGEVYNADLVVWGNYPKTQEDSAQIHIRYIALSNSQDDLSLRLEDIGKQAFSDIYELQEGLLSGGVDDMVYWVLGSIYLQNENYQASLSYLQQISGSGTAEYGLINHMMAKCYYGLSMYDEVLNQYNEAIALNPLDANAYHDRGRLFQRLHQNDQAIADYEEAIRINPKHLKAHYNRKILLDDEVDGGFYLASEMTPIDENEEVPPTLSVEKPEFETPRNEPELAKGNIQIISSPVVEETTTESLNSMSSRAFQFEKEGKIKEAIAIYSAIVVAYPKDGAAFYKRGVLYEKTGAFSKATADYSHAILLEPNNITYYNSRAYLFDRQRMFYKAIDDYTVLIRLNPDDINSYIYRGKAYQYVRKNQEALADFQEVIRRNPLDATGYYFRGKLYAELNQPDNALSDFAKAIAINPGYGSAYRDRAEMYYDKKRYDKALADYDKVLELNPHDAKIFAIRADIHMKMGDPVRAEADFRQAITLDPENGAYQKKLRELTAN
ncbi:MAG: tetratricopeptide repeat protein [Bacteroidia bacterium]